MKNFLFLIKLNIVAIVLAGCTCGSKYKYETVPNDPTQTRIYTLANGLKVYLSVNKDEPRIQTYIGVRVGSKDDPAETTGLAHYFEHLMFKGTQQFGTIDFEAEEPYLDKIEELFEVYRKTTDEAERRAIYAEIDQVSQEASRFAIPNEYDKLMAMIGAQGTNAFTWFDVTAYTENIPSNEIESWAKIQADRFMNPVLRLFHTELETVYEEFNMSLTNDSWRAFDELMNALFPHHPYGTQTTIGRGEHLKNPSITNIKNYFEAHYVPNNMAIIMVGDFDPNETIKIIDQYFGQMPKKELSEFKAEEAQPITEPIVREVIGLEAENIILGFRFPGANSKEIPTLELVSYMLFNGKAGLIDLNLIQKQKTLDAGCYTMPLADYSVFQMYGTPKEGQTLDEVKDLLLGQLEVLKKGEFDEELLQAVINNFRLNQYYQQQYPHYSAHLLLNSFINNVTWKDEVNKINVQSKLTKQDIIDFCNNYFTDNYAVIYKREGKPDIEKIEKPAITPIDANRDAESDFMARIRARTVKPIEPIFIDYEKDMSKLNVKNNIPLLYKQNDRNPLFQLVYVFEMGNNNDKALGTAFTYLDYLGTSQRTAEEIKSEFYRMACSFGVSASNDRVYVFISGLSDNFEKAMELLEERLADAQADLEIYADLVNDILKERADDKLDQRTNFSRLRTYAMYGALSPATNLLSKNELETMNPEELVDRTKNLKNYERTILYYGPFSEKKITELINNKHLVANNLLPVPEAINFVQQEVTENSVLLAEYDAKQIYMAMLYKGGPFDKNIETIRMLYDEYFGGGMSSIVFQEMREARGLAYSAWARYLRPQRPQYSYYINSFIATQNDKMMEAINAFVEILNDMPQSEKAFDIAKENMITSLRTERILREHILWSYLENTLFGYTTDYRKDVFNNVQTMTLEDVVAFQEKYIKGRPYTYCILGDSKDLDLKSLGKIGKITKLTKEEIFGY
ncbi:MAG: insulinase family protein [Bacteroidetes bacterium]|nr:insulinase family protein [Bacteroidota bacterium]MCL2301938.1 insulinase family protein [Lentimicrobiaceae bacterium]